jgi:hypothetical protein
MFSLILGRSDLRGFCLSTISAYDYRQKNPLKYSISHILDLMKKVGVQCVQRFFTHIRMF